MIFFSILNFAKDDLAATICYIYVASTAAEQDVGGAKGLCFFRGRARKSTIERIL